MEEVPIENDEAWEGIHDLWVDIAGLIANHTVGESPAQ
jgi:hypothetical protein